MRSIPATVSPRRTSATITAISGRERVKLCVPSTGSMIHTVGALIEPGRRHRLHPRKPPPRRPPPNPAAWRARSRVSRCSMAEIGRPRHQIVRGAFSSISSAASRPKRGLISSAAAVAMQPVTWSSRRWARDAAHCSRLTASGKLRWNRARSAGSSPTTSDGSPRRPRCARSPRRDRRARRASLPSAASISSITTWRLAESRSSSRRISASTPSPVRADKRHDDTVARSLPQQHRPRPRDPSRSDLVPRLDQALLDRLAEAQLAEHVLDIGLLAPRCRDGKCRGHGRSRPDLMTSSRVARKAATSWVGSSEMIDPTVSERMMRRPLGSSMPRIVGVERREQHKFSGPHGERWSCG